MSCHIDGSVCQKIPAHFILFTWTLQTSYRKVRSQRYDVKNQSPLRLMVSASLYLGDEAHPGLITDWLLLTFPFALPTVWMSRIWLFAHGTVFVVRRLVSKLCMEQSVRVRLDRELRRLEEDLDKDAVSFQLIKRMSYQGSSGRV